MRASFLHMESEMLVEVFVHNGTQTDIYAFLELLAQPITKLNTISVCQSILSSCLTNHPCSASHTHKSAREISGCLS